MNSFNKLITSTITGVCLASGAQAATIEGVDFNITTTYGTTANADALSSGDFPATSNYTAPEGTTSADDLIGAGPINFKDVGTGEINALIQNGSNIPNTTGYGNGLNWKLNLTYNILGTALFQDNPLNVPGFTDGTLDWNNDGEIDNGVVGAGHGLDVLAPTFNTSGVSYIDFFYDDLNNGANDGKQVLRLTLTSFNFSGTSIDLFTKADYNWFTPGDSFVEDFFKLATPVSGLTSFFEIWAANQSLIIPFAVTARTDFNLDPNLVPVVANATDCNDNNVNTACVLTRSTDLNITTRFTVPEPSTLALLGMGLLGMVRKFRLKAI